MHHILKDPVDVIVEFNGKHVRPRSIRWDGKIYKPNSVNLIHRSREGANTIIYFSVSDNTNFMKLRFDPSIMKWHIVELYTD